MTPSTSHLPPRLFLGIDGGGTRTTALLADSAGRALGRLEAGPANLKLLTDAQLTRHFRSIGAAFPQPMAAGIGLAGAWAEPDWQRTRLAAAKVWPGVPCYATHDLETTLAAAADTTRRPPLAQVLVLSGTGSCCYGNNRAGLTAKVGGWGHVLGDQGSGYDIGLEALKTVASHFDETSSWPNLGARLLRALQLNEPNDLIDWAQAATKADLAALAPEVFQAWKARDPLASRILSAAAGRLAADAAHCARKLTAPGTCVRFVLAGSVLLKQPAFRARVARQLRRLWPGALVAPLRREGVWGAIELARRLVDRQAGGRRAEGEGQKSAVQKLDRIPAPCAAPSLDTRHSILAPLLPTPLKTGIMSEDGDVELRVSTAALSPTEERNPRSMELDKLPLAQAITLMLSEEATVPQKLLAERDRLARAVRTLVRAFRRGGRLFYVGAGTSGRLGVLDASECPPTFGTPPGLVQGILAGGQQALCRSVERAEDDLPAGRRAAEFRGVRQRDVMVGIAASGTTPFVWGALAEARKRGATTILLCFNPHLRIPRALRPTIVIAPNLGPEVLTGSTRLKAGTATKLILNLLTTLSMVRLGKVRSNLMIDVDPSNVKLRSRALRIVRALTGADEYLARRELERNGWRVKETVKGLV
ncbi:MAG: N-acetylmuramic acid 6-phosphate etherase [Verrucomicrobiota bacterium]|jgi:N-acetylmuramic acid 6-phosphate etherase